jgi:hypothetical protein
VCEVVDPQFDIVIPFAPPPGAAVDALAAIVRSSTTPVMALELQATGLGESFKSPDPSALEGCLKGAASVCSHRSVRLAVKCRRWTFDLLAP